MNNTLTIKNLLNSHLAKTNREYVNDVGIVIKDQADIDNPSIPFSRTRFVRSPYKSQSNKRNVDFVSPDYDLDMVSHVIQIDGIVNRSISVFAEQIMKNGFEYHSKNDKVQEHLKRRITEIENFTNISFNELMTDVSRQLVSYANCYIIKVRQNDTSKYGKPYTLYGKNQKPIVGFFIAEATTMRVGVNATGQVVEYKQTVGGASKTWDARDVIHFTYNKIPGTFTGKTPILTILDDVRALRKLEEEVEILGFQYSIPLYLYKVGNKDIPAAPGEIAEAAAHVNNMPAYGMLVVPGHHTIEVPSNSNTPVDIMQFIQHFKSRIYSGIGVSSVAMGEAGTSNRNTSEVLDGSLQNITKSYQNILKYTTQLEILREFLLDGGFDPLIEQYEFNFPEIDLENQIKKENNIIQKWQNNLISREEARLELDYDKQINEADTFLQKVDIIKIQTAASVKSEGSSSTSSKKAKNTANKVAPANQYGKSNGRPKYVKNYLDHTKLIIDEYAQLDVSNSNTARQKFLDKISNDLSINSRKLLDSYMSYFKNKYFLPKNLEINYSLYDDYNTEVIMLLQTKVSRFNDACDEKVIEVIDVVTEFIDKQDDKIINLAKILLYKSMGFSTILLKTDACDEHFSRNILVEDFRYHIIPPTSNDCSCVVDEESFNEYA